MGWNAGGYGSMTFPDAKSLTDWKNTTVSADDFDDWINELQLGEGTEWNVARSMKALVKLRHSVVEFPIDGNTVSLLFDAGEDTFRDFGGQLALTLRAGAACGATGTFHFLGTAGAEFDFAYELTLARGRSTLKTLKKAAIAKVYESAAYEAFSHEIMQRLMDSDPTLKKLLSKKK